MVLRQSQGSSVFYQPMVSPPCSGSSLKPQQRRRIRGALGRPWQSSKQKFPDEGLSCVQKLGCVGRVLQLEEALLGLSSSTLRCGSWESTHKPASSPVSFASAKTQERSHQRSRVKRSRTNLFRPSTLATVLSLVHQECTSSFSSSSKGWLGPRRGSGLGSSMHAWKVLTLINIIKRGIFASRKNVQGNSLWSRLRRQMVLVTF